MTLMTNRDALSTTVSLAHELAHVAEVARELSQAAQWMSQLRKLSSLRSHLQKASLERRTNRTGCGARGSSNA